MVKKEDLDAIIKDLKLEFEQRVVELETRLKQVENENIKLSKRVDELEKSQPPQLVWPCSNNGSSSRSQVELNIINSITKETKERERRENNVVIFGVKASTNTDSKREKEENKVEIDKILKKLQVNVNVNNVIKLKSNNGNIAPFVVILNDKKERNSILKKAKDLRDSKEYEKVFINPDQTKAERYNSKLLREECREKNSENKDEEYYYGIRDDKVVKLRK